MTKLLSVLLICSLGLTSVYAADPLIGSWTSATAKNGALKGSIDIRADKTMTLKAEGEPVFTGTWEVQKPGTLKLTVPEAGSSEMSYKLKSLKLSLTYDNGNMQEFIKAKSPVGKGTTK